MMSLPVSSFPGVYLWREGCLIPGGVWVYALSRGTDQEMGHILHKDHTPRDGQWDGPHPIHLGRTMGPDTGSGIIHFPPRVNRQTGVKILPSRDLGSEQRRICPLPGD